MWHPGLLLLCYHGPHLHRPQPMILIADEIVEHDADAVLDAVDVFEHDLDYL